MKDPLSWVPVKFKLPLTFISICLVAFGVGGFVVNSTAQDALGRQIRLRLDARAAATRMVVRHHLDLVGRRAEDFASDGFIRTSLEAIQRGDEAAREPLRRHLLLNKLPLVDSFADAAVLGADGTPVLEVHGGAEGSAAERTSYTSLRPAGGARDYPSFAVATPLLDLDGRRLIGTLVLQVKANTWIAGIRGGESLPEGDEAAVAIRSDATRLHLQGPAEVADAIAYESVIPETGWSLVVSVDRGAITAPAAGLRDRFVAIAGILLAVTALVLFFPVRFLLAPLSRIREAARRITAGDFSVRVRYASKDEIGDLSRAFDLMAAAVEERTRELQRRENAIRLERDRLDAVIGSMRDGLFSIDAGGEISFANRAAQPLVRELRDRSRHAACARSREATCLACLHAAILPRGACSLEVGGRVYEVHVSELPGGGDRLCVSRDITDRLAQARIQAHQERMSVLGNISAVMAHELNNPLAAIAMFSQMLESQLEEGTSARESASVIRRNAETCKRTIRDLLDTAVHAPPHHAEFDLVELVDDVRRFLRPIWQRAGVEFAVETTEEPATLTGDELQLRQVLINLVMNAVQAMDDGGRVTVRVERDGTGFRLDVTDTGQGIPDELRSRIFDSFFTTKPPSVGTGLGLSTSRRIVTAHGGSLELASTGPSGSTFRVLLPAQRGAPLAEVADA